MRRLRALPGPLEVAVFDDWRDDPGRRLREAVAAPVGVKPEGSLADTLEAVCARLGGELYVILDGAEEYFVYHAGESKAGTFAADFPDDKNGALAGPWGRLAMMRQQKITVADVDVESLGARSLSGLQLMGRRGIFVNSVGDVDLLPLVLDAAKRFNKPPEDGVMQDLIEDAQQVISRDDLSEEAKAEAVPRFRASLRELRRAICCPARDAGECFRS